MKNSRKATCRRASKKEVVMIVPVLGTGIGEVHHRVTRFVILCLLHIDGPPHRPHMESGLPSPPPPLLHYMCTLHPHVNYAQVMGPLRIACLNTIMGI